jgi:hypothetical protein
MIPHLKLSSEIFANDLKDRVTACRKRLRLNRVHKTQFDNQLDELFETTSDRKAVVITRDGARLPPVDEHEVGIT